MEPGVIDAIRNVCDKKLYCGSITTYIGQVERSSE